MLKLFLIGIVAYWLIFWTVVSIITLIGLSIQSFKDGNPLYEVVILHVVIFIFYVATLYFLPLLVKDEDSLAILLTPFTLNFEKK